MKNELKMDREMAQKQAWDIIAAINNPQGYLYVEEIFSPDFEGISEELQTIIICCKINHPEHEDYTRGFLEGILLLGYVTKEAIIQALWQRWHNMHANDKVVMHDAY